QRVPQRQRVLAAGHGDQDAVRVGEHAPVVGAVPVRGRVRGAPVPAAGRVDRLADLALDVVAEVGRAPGRPVAWLLDDGGRAAHRAGRPVVGPTRDDGADLELVV